MIACAGLVDVETAYATLVDVRRLQVSLLTGGICLYHVVEVVVTSTHTEHLQGGRGKEGGRRRLVCRANEHGGMMPGVL